MKKIITINGLLAIAILTHHMSISSMENNNCALSLNLQRAMHGYNADAVLAAEHNRNNQLLLLPDDPLKSIIAYSVDVTTKPLKDIIKPCLLLSTTCKRFSLKMIGAVCQQHYNNDEKNRVMEHLLWRMNRLNYWNMRRGAFLLVYAGAYNAVKKDISLLGTAIGCKDKELITTLFEHGANPNQKSTLGPIWFFIKDAAILQQFIAQGVDPHAKGEFKLNVLWSNMLHNPSVELIKIYLAHKVDATIINKSTGNCIMHDLVRYEDCMSNNLTAIAQVLLDAHPDLINIRNKKGETPLDMAEHFMKSYSGKEYLQYTIKPMSSLIALFKERGGKTAQQLRQDNLCARNINNELSDCIICLGPCENMMNIPCLNAHADRICVGCYDSSLKFSENCPLCRAVLL